MDRTKAEGWKGRWDQELRGRTGWGGPGAEEEQGEQSKTGDGDG